MSWRYYRQNDELIVRIDDMKLEWYDNKAGEWVSSEFTNTEKFISGFPKRFSVVSISKDEAFLEIL